MGEFNKDQSGKPEQDDKSAFGQFEKGEQSKESFGQDEAQADKPVAGEEKQAAGAQGTQKEFLGKQRQQGDEDLGDDSIDNQNLKPE